MVDTWVFHPVDALFHASHQTVDKPFECAMCLFRQIRLAQRFQSQRVVMLDCGVGGLANAQSLVKGSHGRHFFIANGVGVVEPAAQFNGIVALRTLHSADEQVRFFIVHDVATNFFAKRGFVAPHIEHVVLQLEGETQREPIS